MIRALGKTVNLSARMTTMDEIKAVIEMVGQKNLLLICSTSPYTCQPSELNLKMIQTVGHYFNYSIDYSRHKAGVVTTVVGVH